MRGQLLHDHAHSIVCIIWMHLYMPMVKPLDAIAQIPTQSLALW